MYYWIISNGFKNSLNTSILHYSIQFLKESKCSIKSKEDIDIKLLSAINEYNSK